MTITPGYVSQDTFDFALPHAVSLAEAGRGVEEKRTGVFHPVRISMSSKTMPRRIPFLR